MSSFATIGVDDYLAACESSIAMRTTDDKLASGVDVVCDTVIEEGEYLRIGDSRLDAGNEYIDDILTYLALHLFV